MYRLYVDYLMTMYQIQHLFSNELYDRMTVFTELETNWQASSHGLFQGTVPAFAWRK